MKLSDFFTKYTKDEVKAYFQNPYNVENKWEELKDTFMFHYVCGKEKELPRSFVNDHLHLVAKGVTDPKEIEYVHWRIFSSVMHNYPLGDKLLTEYSDKIEWSSISYRKDMTLEFFNQHQDKIILKDITADLGSEFISTHLEALDKHNLKQMKLTEEQATKLIALKKASVDDFWKQSFFTKEYAFKNLKALKERVSSLNQRFNFTFEEKLSVLKELDNCSWEQDEWNGIIGEFMGDAGLSLEQKKDLKWLAWI